MRGKIGGIAVLWLTAALLGGCVPFFVQPKTYQCAGISWSEVRAEGGRLAVCEGMSRAELEEEYQRVWAPRILDRFPESWVPGRRAISLGRGRCLRRIDSAPETQAWEEVRIPSSSRYCSSTTSVVCMWVMSHFSRLFAAAAASANLPALMRRESSTSSALRSSCSS